jgi:hypothetical protein
LKIQHGDEWATDLQTSAILSPSPASRKGGGVKKCALDGKMVQRVNVTTIYVTLSLFCTFKRHSSPQQQILISLTLNYPAEGETARNRRKITLKLNDSS